jgi:sporulation protein YlmC with PRC-barrel domain
MEVSAMKMLLSTTALVIGLGLASVISAQTTAPKPNPATAQPVQMPGFLAMRDQSDLFASELIGHDVFARRTAMGTTVTGGQATSGVATTADGSHNLAAMKRADLDAMDNIGQITEIVLSSDGRVRALVIGVGGFLGMGEQDVAITMDQVTFAADPDDRSAIYIVVNTSGDMLKGSPRYERSAMVGEGTVTPGTPRADRTPFVAPKMAREGYNQVSVTEVSSEMLVGKDVYGVNDKSVGTIENLILDDKGAITNVIVDFGGFLGMGSTQVSIGFEELTILANAGRADVRVYVDATKEQIQSQPQYRATN